jgi:hypothetical protein
MTKLALALIAAAIVLVGGLALMSPATALFAPANPTGLIQGQALPVHKAGCLLAGRYCRVGYHFVCGLPPNPERRRCHCVPCS